MKKLFLASFLIFFTLASTMAQDLPIWKVKKGKKINTFATVSPDATANQRGADLLRTVLPMTADEDMIVKSTVRDDLGFTHQKHEQYYKGIKVDGSTYTVHTKSGAETILSGNYRSVIGNVNIKPVLNSSQAIELAKNHVGAELYAWETTGILLEVDANKPAPELVIVADMDNQKPSQLAWKMEMNAAYPLYRSDIYIHAQTGDVIQEYTKICLADAVGAAATRYSGTQNIHTDSYNGSFRLRDVTRDVITYDASFAGNTSGGVPSPSYDYTDSNNNWTASEYNNAKKDNAALDAHFAASATHEYFLTTFGRDSYNASGATIKSYVNCDIEQAYGYPAGYNDNAFWNGTAMVYGKGASLDPLTTVDITAHEVGHAFCEYTCNLVYSYESGAMNESLSDIWGTCVENFTNNNYGTNKDLWNLGTEIGSTFRSMSNPNAHNQPDTYKGTAWYTGSGDNGGVHYNSGVGNHWFYLLTVGKNGVNDNGDSYSVSGIGIDKAAAITWRSQSVYLSTNSQYADWRTYAIQSAVDLYGAGSNEEQQVTNAWHAVGIGNAYSGGNPPPSGGCVEGDLTLTITLDNYPSETTWTVKNSGGTTVASGGSYGTANSTVTENINGLADGNYTFTINDSYGDGICCSYGNGSYTLASSDGTTVANGGSFTSSESTSFCVEAPTNGADTQAPSTPGNVTASNITNTTATISWSASSDNVGVTGYDFLYNGNSITTTTGTSINLSGMTDCTTYTFDVVAYDAAGNRSNAGSVTLTTTGCAEPPPPSGPTELIGSSFETGMEGWLDGGGDCYRLNSTTYAYEGNYSIRLRDNSSTASSMTTASGYDLTGYTQVDIEFYFKANSMENGEDFWVRYHDGSSWKTVASYASGTNFNNGTFYTATVTISSNDYNFVSNGKFRFQCDASANADQVYIDKVTITASSGAGLLAGGSVSGQTIEEVTTSRGKTELPSLDINVYPNPTADYLNIEGDASINAVKVFSINGSLIMNRQDMDNFGRINVSDLMPGTYFLLIETEEGIVREKFIKL